MSFSVLYYSNDLEGRPVVRFCFEHLLKETQRVGAELIVVSWRAMPGNGFRQIVWNNHIPCHRTIYMQILAGLKLRLHRRVVLAEHDVLYPGAYLEWMAASIAENPSKLIYNTNLEHLSDEGYFESDQRHLWLSCLGGCAQVLEQAFRIKAIEAEATGFVMASEPGVNEGFKVHRTRCSQSVLDFRDGQNFTGMRRPATSKFRERSQDWGSREFYKHLLKRQILDGVEDIAS